MQKRLLQSLYLTVAKEAMLVQAGTVSSYLELSHAEGSSQQVKHFTVMLVLPLTYLQSCFAPKQQHNIFLRTVPAGSHLYADALTFQ